MFKSTLCAFALTLLVIPFAIQASATASALTATAATSASVQQVDEKALAEFNSSVISLCPVGNERLVDVLKADNIEAFMAWPARENVITDADHNKKTILDWARAFKAAKIAAHVESIVADDIINHSASDSETTKTLNHSASDSDTTKVLNKSASDLDLDKSADSANDDSAAKIKKKSESALAKKTRDLIAAQKDTHKS